MRFVATSIFVLVVILTLTTFGMVNIRPTEVGVSVNKALGKVSDQPLGVGYHFFNRWITDITTYRVAAKTFPDGVERSERSEKYFLDLKTKDGQNVYVDLNIIYMLKTIEVPRLHVEVGKQYEDQIITPIIRSEARLVIGGFSAEEIYQGSVREAIQNTIKDKLQESVKKYPAIMINDVLIRHLTFSEAFEKAIEEKKLAAQQVEINKNLALAQEEKAKQQEALARGEKLKAIQEAEGRAASAKIEADAERYKLEQEAAGSLAKYKADAEGKRLSAEALGGGQNVVALEFARNIPSKLQIWGIPTGQNSTSLMDLNGLFGKMLLSKEDR